MCLCIKLFSKLPFDIVINNILPFTYNIQKREHTADIRSFYIDYRLIQTMFYDYNEFIILHYLKIFIESNYEIVLARHRLGKYNNMDKIQHFLYNDYNVKNIECKIWFLFGLLTPIERTRFFNEFYIDINYYLE